MENEEVIMETKERGRGKGGMNGMMDDTKDDESMRRREEDVIQRILIDI